MIAAGRTYLLKIAWWWIIGIALPVLSQMLIVLYWPVAKYGISANILIALFLWISRHYQTSACGPPAVKTVFRRH